MKATELFEIFKRTTGVDPELILGYTSCRHILPGEGAPDSIRVSVKYSEDVIFSYLEEIEDDTESKVVAQFIADNIQYLSTRYTPNRIRELFNLPPIEEKPLDIIAVDFDGTLCENKWPEIGIPNRELIQYLKERQAAGAKIVLWTCRVGHDLTAANWWCHGHDLFFDAVNENLPEIVKQFGTDSRKIFATEYIDDRAINKFELPFIPSKEQKMVDRILELHAYSSERCK